MKLWVMCKKGFFVSLIKFSESLGKLQQSMWAFEFIHNSLIDSCKLRFSKPSMKPSSEALAISLHQTSKLGLKCNRQLNAFLRRENAVEFIALKSNRLKKRISLLLLIGRYLNNYSGINPDKTWCCNWRLIFGKCDRCIHFILLTSLLLKPFHAKLCVSKWNTLSFPHQDFSAPSKKLLEIIKEFSLSKHQGKPTEFAQRQAHGAEMKMERK